MTRRVPAPETARLYATDWQAFDAWCTRAGLPTLPAAPATVAAFLAAARAGGKYGAGALGRRAAAIADRHRRAGLPSPAADPAVRTIFSAARRAATPRRKPPSRPAQLLRMAAACPGDLSGIRDRAVLLLLAAAGLGRAALVGLDVEHLRFTATAVELSLHASSARRRQPAPRHRSLRRHPGQLSGAGAAGLAANLRYAVRAGVPQDRPLGQRRAVPPGHRCDPPDPGAPHAAPGAPSPQGGRMTRAPAAKATQAADALLAWLRDQPPRAFSAAARAGGFRAARTNAGTTDASPHDAPPGAGQAGQGPAQTDVDGALDATRAAAALDPSAQAEHGANLMANTVTPAVTGVEKPGGAPLRLAHTDWLHHRLTVAGPNDAVAAFRAAAAGAGEHPLAPRPRSH